MISYRAMLGWDGSFRWVERKVPAGHILVHPEMWRLYERFLRWKTAG